MGTKAKKGGKDEEEASLPEGLGLVLGASQKPAGGNPAQV